MGKENKSEVSRAFNSDIVGYEDFMILIFLKLIHMLKKQHSWEKYEDYTSKILNDEMVHKYLEDYFNLVNLKIKPKEKILGKKTGTIWEVDGYGYDTNNQIILIECKHYSNRKVGQNKLAAFAYIIQDVGASRGIVVTTLEAQSGAIKVAEAENIGLLQLDYNSTDQNFVVRFRANETKQNQIVAAFSEQIYGISFTSSSKIKDYPIPTREQVEKAKERLHKRTNRMNFSDSEIIEEFAKMQEEM